MRLASLFVLVFLQMLPATLVASAIRPLFAAQHGGDESAMHAFMSVNMLAAALVAPFLGPRLVRARHAGAWLAVLCLADGVLLWACAQPWQVGLVLSLRAVEGAVHVTGATVLISEAASRVRALGRPGLMGAFGGAIMAAIAAGMGAGGALTRFGPRAPFLTAAIIAVGVALLIVAGVAALGDRSPVRDARAGRSDVPAAVALRGLLVPLGAAFAGRFTVGCLVVTFALFAHRSHALSDARIGGLFAALTVPFALATWPAAHLAARVGKARLLAAGVVAWAAVLLSLPHVPTLALLPLMLAGGLASAAIFATTLAYASSPVEPAVRARALALFNGVGALGMVLGPPAAGLVAVAAGRGAAGDRAAFFLAGGALLVWLVVGARWLVRHARAEAQGAT